MLLYCLLAFGLASSYIEVHSNLQHHSDLLTTAPSKQRNPALVTAKTSPLPTPLCQNTIALTNPAYPWQKSRTRSAAKETLRLNTYPQPQDLLRSFVLRTNVSTDSAASESAIQGWELQELVEVARAVSRSSMRKGEEQELHLQLYWNQANDKGNGRAEAMFT
ncbi:uncharacterized protein BDZ99DRAFT_513195 [Mytilinidion resinicola]|uniref:Uncharacterized protein n=1 Tax=Mytilinidion resinicola TaxID=574789 RepID=A0A6A6Z9N5_9PEZI|nr:uncharacterized protein BDZ99DRAFT_513195 [Mytilinidion resinicola]KAF2816927.1 hypothetical protein BDZ99DRAFT_513195 [Mytilinidion resinicola]